MFIKILLYLTLITSCLFGQYGWDGNNFSVPGTLYSTDHILVGTIKVTQTLTITNGSDSLVIDVDGSGSTSFTTEDIMNIIASEVQIEPSSTHLTLKLSTNDGTTGFLMLDSGSILMFSVDSDGDVDTGQWKATSIANAYLDNNITVTPIDATTETAIEAVVDLEHLQGAVTDAQVPDNITTTGLTGTYTFGGGGSGDIASMTFAGGRLTGITTVP